MKTAARLTEVIIAELRRQAETSGCTTEDNGKLVQVDGSFDAEQLALAIIKASSGEENG